MSYKLDTQNLCADFHEDIEFHFTLGWHALVRKFLAPHNASLALALGANVSYFIYFSGRTQEETGRKEGNGWKGNG